MKNVIPCFKDGPATVGFHIHRSDKLKGVSSFYPADKYVEKCIDAAGS